MAVVVSLELCFLVCLLLRPPHLVVSYSSGPPMTICESMTPDKDQHSAVPTTTDVPYQLDVSETKIEAGVPIEVTLSKNDPQVPDFRGFLVVAMDSDGSIFGQFEPTGNNTKIVGCGPDKNGGVSHNNPIPKSSVTLKWTPTSFSGGDAKKVDFFFTVVQTREVFWVKQAGKSSVKVEPSLASPIVTPSTEKSAALHIDYLGCGSSKGCFGINSNCIPDGSCQAMFAYKYNSDTKVFEFMLHGREISKDEYIAVGISSDGQMGDDLVFSCIEGLNEINIGWNSGKDNIKGVKNVAVTNKGVKNENGYFNCKFEVPGELNPIPPRETQSKKYDFYNEKFYILLAIGKSDGSGGLTYHESRAPSTDSVDLKSISVTAGSGSTGWLIQVHGCLMIFAWLALAASGMYMARYYKQTFKSIRPMDKDFWFRFHQLCMVLAVALSLIAFFVMLAAVRVEPFNPSALKQNPHAVIGIVCIICSVVQPCMAFFRCHPGTSNRWIFDWAHWFVGNSALLLGIAAIFLAIQLPMTFLPAELTEAMIAYVVLHAIFHGILTMQRFYYLKNPKDPKEGGDAPGSLIRKLVGLTYFLFVWVFSIAFVVIIFKSRPDDK